MIRGAQSSGFLEAEAVSWHTPPAPAQPEPSYQLFEVHASTEMGDTVFLVGSADLLGNWEVDRGVRMSTSPARYPIWYIWLPGCLPPCEFKFVIARHNGERNWEPGKNRNLAPCTTRVAAIFGISQSIISTAEGDSELYRLRGVLATTGGPVHASGTRSEIGPPAVAQNLNGSLAPHRPQIQTVDLRQMPPPLSLGSPLQPREPWQSVESSACPSRCSSVNGLVRSPSTASGVRPPSAASSAGVEALKRTPSKSCLANGSLQVSRSLSTTGMRSGNASSNNLLKRTVSFNELGNSDEQPGNAEKRPSRNGSNGSNGSNPSHWSMPNV